MPDDISLTQLARTVAALDVRHTDIDRNSTGCGFGELAGDSDPTPCLIALRGCAWDLRFSLTARDRRCPPRTSGS